MDKPSHMPSWISIGIAVAAFCVSFGGYVFEVRNNSTRIEVLTNELARKDVVGEQIGTLRSELVSIKEQLKANSEAAMKAYQKSQENNEILSRYLQTQLDKRGGVRN